MKLQLLPSTIENGAVSAKQHLSCFVVDDLVSIDAGSLAISANELQRKQIRDVVLTHAHIDHIAGLPLFIDDLFAEIAKPVEVYASQEIIDILERDIFNWDVYPRFSALENEHGAVMKYRPFVVGKTFKVEHLEITPIAVNHKVPAVGFIVSDGISKFAITGDTAEMDQFWTAVNQEEGIDALLIECAFPTRLDELAQISHHMTPSRLENELKKFNDKSCPIYVINMKPSYYREVLDELESLDIENVKILEVGREYEMGEAE
ncbi:MAG: 3',5'-cyclic-nucleotide phosphodiesterase [Pyrinomonadaceae bacterium]|nr:3',5'-cyclic-nucleotide phosphodiesterase [Pyrinomonadaceae bacterium]